MRVVDKVIFCEGGSESLDFQLINNRVLSNNITIIPVGGKFNFSLFIKAYFYIDIDKKKNDENNKKQNNEETQKVTKKYIIFSTIIEIIEREIKIFFPQDLRKITHRASLH